MKRVLLILDDDIERIAVTTYHRDFPGAETLDVGSDHSLAVDDGDEFDLRFGSAEQYNNTNTSKTVNKKVRFARLKENITAARGWVHHLGKTDRKE